MPRQVEFSQIEVGKIQNSLHNLSHTVTQSLKPGIIVPTVCKMMMPGDIVGCKIEALNRVAPLIAPFFGMVEVKFEAFFVPNRILWPNWKYYIAGERAPGVEVDHVHPYLELTEAQFNALTAEQKKYWNYFGLPRITDCLPWANGSTKINAFPFAAQNMIYNEWYRAQQIIPEIPFELTDGANPYSEFLVQRRRAWEHDMFTASLPNAQQGDPIDIPLGKVILGDPGTANQIRRASDHLLPAAGNVDTAASGNLHWDNTVVNWDAVIDPNGAWDVGATTINDLRLAWIVQKWKEKNARGGTRYPELLLNHFGIRPQDARLQRPEYLFGVKTPMKIGEVLNTTGTVSAPQANMAGHGIAVTNGGYDRYFVQEHGWYIVNMSIMPKPAYQQGIAKEWLIINEPTEYPWPSFAHIGEEEVYNEEVAAWQGVNNKGTFGYNPRYYWMKFANNRSAGDFMDTLDFWTWTRIFSSVPALNQSFIECNPDSRIFAVQDGTDQFWSQVYCDLRVIRELPKFSTPR